MLMHDPRGNAIVAPDDWQDQLHKLWKEHERLRALIEDACKVFEHYDLPEHAFHYRRVINQQSGERT